MAILLLGIAAAVAAAAWLGVFARGDGTTAPATSIRGESYEYATTGVYAYNAQRVVAEGVGWDVFTLFVVVPSLVVAAWLGVAARSRGACSPSACSRTPSTST